MQHERDNGPATAVDRGAYQDAVTPWDRPKWRAAALAWIARELAAHGLRESGPRTVRLRPWSVLVRTHATGLGTVWFKANPPASAFEAPLTEALARWTPEHVLRPIAVDADRGWSLLPDGGTLFKTALGGGPVDPRAWEEPLRQYAHMQRALTPYADEIERLGVPGARTRELPDVVDRLVTDSTALAADDRRRLRALRPRLVEWSAELAAVGIEDTLDHADLHEGQLFHPEPGRYTFFDWGDATVSHPFCSFRVPARRVLAEDRGGTGRAALLRLRDAYLEPWTGDGASSAELRRAMSLSWRLGAVGRAASWGRLFPGASRASDVVCAAQSAASLLELFDAPPALD
ncbi:aminoglycoside phosphotransferase family protein [Streptomyces sp. NPDC017979]|uniref:aminoglycoside phosphotransferase family protein n=1 Tax=Streptomyces sp. NPDC017979 TaxID=3365024 RepID=UPI00378ECF41